MQAKKTIWFVLGTAGELIKVFPVMKRASEAGLKWGLIHTGQSGLNFWKQWDKFQLKPSAPVVKLLERPSDLKSSVGAGSWFFQFISQAKAELLSQKLEVMPEPGDLYVVHGDTLSTLAGTLLAWRLSGKICHIEAGLRSQDLFEPFPEEINRRLTSLLIDVHYPPDQVAYENLVYSGTGGEILNTRANTLLDALNDTIELGVQADSKPGSPYVVANLHRYENLSNESRWQLLIETTLKAQDQFPVVFAMHPPTQQKLEEDAEAKQRLLIAGVELRERIPFFEFVDLLHGCEYVLSDGGSNQEECFYMGKPCLIMRETTERVEGLGENAVMSFLRASVIDQFLADYQKYKREPYRLPVSTSQQIVDDLQSRIDSSLRL